MKSRANNEGLASAQAFFHTTLPRHRGTLLSFRRSESLATYCVTICIFKNKISLSASLAGQTVGIKEVDEGIWLVSFMDEDPGYIDLEEKAL